MSPLWPLLSALLIVSVSFSALLTMLFVATNRRRKQLESEITETRAVAADARAQQSAAEARVERLAAVEGELLAERSRSNAADRELAGLRASLAEKENALKALREELDSRFAAIAQSVLETQTDRLTNTNKEKLDTLLVPLKGQIDKFEKAFVDDGKERANQSSALKTLVETLSKDTEKTLEAANNLTRALKGSSKTQGAWGELILDQVLRMSGLRAGQEYVVQEARTADDGARIIPDVTLRLPNGQCIVIDSKVSLSAFHQCVNCEDDAERPLHLRAHTDSLRGHIKGLNAKDYSAHYGNIDFVLMFVPIEGALSLALQTEPDITAYAISRNVFLTTPMTLLLALRTVENLWRVERQNQNADEIARLAGKLYGSFVEFISEMKAVKAGLDKAHSNFDDAFKRLGTGRDNLVRLSQRVKDLGAKTNKSIPDDVILLTQDADVGEIHDAKVISISEAARSAPGDEQA